MFFLCLRKHYPSGLSSEAQCTSCDGTKFCSSTGLSAPDGTCQAGYFCKSGATNGVPENEVNSDGEFNFVARFISVFILTFINIISTYLPLYIYLSLFIFIYIFNL